MARDEHVDPAPGAGNDRTRSLTMTRPARPPRSGPRGKRVCAPVTLAAALLLPALVAAQTVNDSVPAMSSTWRQVQIDGVTVIGTARSARLLQVANGIAAFRSALSVHLPGVRVVGELPTFVVVLEDFEAYKRYQPKDSRGRRMENVTGYFNMAADANFVVIPHVRGEVGDSLLYHEFTHYIVRQNASAVVPLWLEEGLAEFYATFRPDFAGGSLIGAASPQRTRTLRQEPYLPLRDLVSLSPFNGQQLLRSERVGMFYAEAWALVHYVTVARKNPVRTPISMYLTTLAATDSQDEAFRAAFGVDVEGMSRELQEYIRHFSFETIVIPRAAAAPAERVEPVAEAEARQLDEALLEGSQAPDEPEKDLGRSF